MKKLTALLLSLLMCLSLLAVPAQAAFTPDPDGPGIIEVTPTDPTGPGDKDPNDPDDPGISVQGDKQFPEELEDMPTD